MIAHARDMCRESGMKIWIQFVWGGRRPKIGVGQNVPNSARFLTTLDFDRHISLMCPDVDNWQTKWSSVLPWTTKFGELWSNDKKKLGPTFWPPKSTIWKTSLSGPCPIKCLHMLENDQQNDHSLPGIGVPQQLFKNENFKRGPKFSLFGLISSGAGSGINFTKLFYLNIIFLETRMPKIWKGKISKISPNFARLSLMSCAWASLGKCLANVKIERTATFNGEIWLSEQVGFSRSTCRSLTLYWYSKVYQILSLDEKGLCTITTCSNLRYFDQFRRYLRSKSQSVKIAPNFGRFMPPLIVRMRAPKIVPMFYTCLAAHHVEKLGGVIFTGAKVIGRSTRNFRHFLNFHWQKFWGNPVAGGACVIMSCYCLVLYM